MKIIDVLKTIRHGGSKFLLHYYDFKKLTQDYYPILSDRLVIPLILIGSLLLGIWSTKGTIGLRNILLLLGAIISFMYCFGYFKHYILRISFKSLIPALMLGLVFVWVLIHYLYLSRFPEIQLKELSSTWLRSLLAVITGFGIGIAIYRNQKITPYLWVGLLISFLYYLYQFSILILFNQSMTYYWKYEKFIYPGKVNAVVAGTILIAGVIGIVSDQVSRFSTSVKLRDILFTLAGINVPLFIYIFIIDSRNGVVLAFFIFTFVLALLLVRATLQFITRNNQLIKIRNIATLIAILLFGIIFTSLQYETNAAWSSMVQDAKVAFQINHIENWKDPRRLGYPINESGTVVIANNYERISWAIVAITKLVPENTLGIGVLTRPFGILLNEEFPGSGYYINSSHSAWIEITLAYGIPGIFLLLGSLFLMTGYFCRQVFLLKNSSFHQFLPVTISCSLIFLYGISEISSQHGIEILCFWLAFLSAMYMQDFNKCDGH